MPRSSRLFGVLLLLLVVVPVMAPAAASAQGVGPQMPRMPLAVDLKKVPVGSWADYATTIPGMAPVSTRMLLVARSANTVTFEAEMEGGMVSRVGKTAIQMVIQGDPTKDESVRSQAIQIGANDPMEVPAKMAGGERQGFQKPNPKMLVGTETIKVPAGTFKTKHYRDKSAQSGQADFWINEEVNPLGLIKLEAETAGAPGLPRGTVKIELTGSGKDGKPVITKAPRPFDQAILMGELMSAMGGAGGAPAPGKNESPNGATAPGKAGAGGAAAPPVAKPPKK